MILYKEGISDFEPWSGAVSTWDNLVKYDKIDDLETTLDELFPDGMSETDLNDLLWFEPESIYEWVGLHYNENTGDISDEPFPECHFCGKTVDKNHIFIDDNDDVWCLACKQEYYEDPDDVEEEYDEEDLDEES